MAPVRRRGRSSVVVGRRRAPSNWARSVSTALLTIPAASKVLVATVALSNPGIGETVRRTRGVISLASDQNIASEVQFGAFGFIVVNDLAIAAGVASIPGPVTDASDDGWFVWQPYVFRQSGAGDTRLRMIEFDSKAMRRIEEGFTVAIVAENSHATQGQLFQCGFSLLSSLS